MEDYSHTIIAFIALFRLSVLTNKVTVFIKKYICFAKPTLKAGHERRSGTGLTAIALRYCSIHRRFMWKLQANA